MNESTSTEIELGSIVHQNAITTENCDKNSRATYS